MASKTSARTSLNVRRTDAAPPAPHKRRSEDMSTNDEEHRSRHKARKARLDSDLDAAEVRHNAENEGDEGMDDGGEEQNGQAEGQDDQGGDDGTDVADTQEQEEPEKIAKPTIRFVAQPKVQPAYRFQPAQAHANRDGPAPASQDPSAEPPSSDDAKPAGKKPLVDPYERYPEHLCDIIRRLCDDGIFDSQDLAKWGPEITDDVLLGLYGCLAPDRGASIPDIMKNSLLMSFDTSKWIFTAHPYTMHAGRNVSYGPPIVKKSKNSGTKNVEAGHTFIVTPAMTIAYKNTVPQVKVTPEGKTEEKKKFYVGLSTTLPEAVRKRQPAMQALVRAHAVRANAFGVRCMRTLWDFDRSKKDNEEHLIPLAWYTHYRRQGTNRLKGIVAKPTTEEIDEKAFEVMVEEMSNFYNINESTDTAVKPVNDMIVRFSRDMFLAMSDDEKKKVDAELASGKAPPEDQWNLIDTKRYREKMRYMPPRISDANKKRLQPDEEHHGDYPVNFGDLGYVASPFGMYFKGDKPKKEEFGMQLRGVPWDNSTELVHVQKINRSREEKNVNVSYEPIDLSDGEDAAE